jgi:predicted transcriptional regulator
MTDDETEQKIQTDLQAERQKTEHLRDAFRKLDVELDSIITHVQMMPYPNTNGWIIDKLRKIKRTYVPK